MSTAAMAAFLGIPRIRREMAPQIREEMVEPLRKVVASAGE